MIYTCMHCGAPIEYGRMKGGTPGLVWLHVKSRSIYCNRHELINNGGTSTVARPLR